MILAIVGSRFFNDFQFVKKMVLKTINIRTVEKIISGGAKGVDSCAKDLADYYSIPFDKHPAKWYTVDGKFDKSAGIRRNILIINAADVVIAFWDGRTEHCGTKHDIDYCIEKNKEIHVIMISENNFGEHLDLKGIRHIYG